MRGRVVAAFQGELGAYSQSAVYSFFGKEKVRKVVPLPTLRSVFSSLFERKKETPGYAVVPIENSIAGSVGETFDLLASEDVRIVGEVSISINHALIISKKSSLRDIKKVLSHPQALAQCSKYLNSHSWKQIPVYDTAGAVKMIKEQELRDSAAIASELSCEIYGMKLAKKNVEDDLSNRTRFLVLRPANQNLTDRKLTGSDKTSLIFSTQHSPGSLVRALTALASRGINLTRIESRPIRSKPWEYYFYLDFEGHMLEERCAQAIEDLRRNSLGLKILGSYRKST